MNDASGQQQVAAVTAADDVEQTRDPVRRIEAERDLGQAEARAVGREAKVLRDGEHQPAAERVAIHGGQRHLRERGESRHQRGLAARQRLGLLA